jgi:type VII secretion protein EccB
VRNTGAVYVRIEDVVHPVLNLTSARLIAATDADPHEVTEAAVVDAKPGVLLGIPGAPTLTGTPLADLESTWTVCDDETTTVMVGPPAAAGAAAGHAILVTGPSKTDYLLYSGLRARVDLNDPAVLQILGAEDIRPAPVSRALLELLPEVPPFSPPPIPDSGAPAPAALPGFRIGDIVAVRQATGTEFLVVLGGGVQQVSQVAADLIRYSGAGTAVTAVAPEVVNTLPRLGALAVATFPERIDEISGAGDGAVCAAWTAGNTEILVGGRPPNVPVRLAQADGAGPLTDAVYLPPGRSAYVRAVGTRTGAGSIVTDRGVRFPVGDAESARILGLPEVAADAPRAVLEALPLGPALTRSAALTAYDTIAAGSP